SLAACLVPPATAPPTTGIRVAHSLDPGDGRPDGTGGSADGPASRAPLSAALSRRGGTRRPRARGPRTGRAGRAPAPARPAGAGLGRGGGPSRVNPPAAPPGRW